MNKTFNIKINLDISSEPNITEYAVNHLIGLLENDIAQLCYSYSGNGIEINTVSVNRDISNTL